MKDGNMSEENTKGEGIDFVQLNKSTRGKAGRPKGS